MAFKFRFRQVIRNKASGRVYMVIDKVTSFGDGFYHLKSTANNKIYIVAADIVEADYLRAIGRDKKRENKCL